MSPRSSCHQPIFQGVRWGWTRFSCICGTVAPLYLLDIVASTPFHFSCNSSYFCVCLCKSLLTTGLLHFLFELRHTSSFCRACPGRFLHVNASCVQSTSNCSASLYSRSVCCHNAPKAHGILHLTSAHKSSPTHCVEATCTSLSGAAPMECTSIRHYPQDSRSP